jgi:hypothetical protein
MSLQYRNLSQIHAGLFAASLIRCIRLSPYLQWATRVVIMAAERKYSEVLREGMSMVGAAVRGGCAGGGFITRPATRNSCRTADGCGWYPAMRSTTVRVLPRKVITSSALAPGAAVPGTSQRLWLTPWTSTARTSPGR